MKKIFFLLIITICSLTLTSAQPTRTLPSKIPNKIPNKTTYKPHAKPPVVIKSPPLDAKQTDKLILVIGQSEWKRIDVDI